MIKYLLLKTEGMFKTKVGQDDERTQEARQKSQRDECLRPPNVLNSTDKYRT